jgi:hypothetical protein
METLPANGNEGGIVSEVPFSNEVVSIEQHQEITNKLLKKVDTLTRQLAERTSEAATDAMIAADLAEQLETERAKVKQLEGIIELASSDYDAAVIKHMENQKQQIADLQAKVDWFTAEAATESMLHADAAEQLAARDELIDRAVKIMNCPHCAEYDNGCSPEHSFDTWLADAKARK